MIRQTVRSLALVAVGLALAGGAWGQALRQSSSAEAMVALEYFGAAGGREIEASGFDLDGDNTNGQQRPYVGLTPTADILVGNVADVTFTLTGATFSQTVSPANLDRRAGCATATTEAGLSVAVDSGGARGDSSVTFKVEVTGTAAFGSSSAMCFWIPNVQATLANLSPPGTPPAMQERGVAVTATIKQGVTNSSPFPAKISGPQTADVDANEDGDNTDDNEVGTAPNTDNRIFIGARALATDLGTGGEAMVALADRSKIVSGGTPDPSASDPKTAAMGLLVGTLTVATASNAASIWQLDGGGAVVDADGDLDGSLGGQVTLSVGGPFQDGDKVVFDLPGESTRSVSPSGGMATTSVELAPGSTPIVYVPGGTGVLKPAKFAAMAKYAFNSLDNNNALPIMASVGSITYQGITVEGYAYGVVKGGGMDTSYVRATCEATTGMCQVFADCTGQDGTAYFGGPVSIAAGTTGVVDSDAIAAALGGGWDSGRGRCDIWSTAPLAVQHMVRSGHTLINSSAVVGRSLDEGADTGDAIAEVKMVVDNICSSIGTDGDSDPMTNDGSGDTACQPMTAP